MQVLSLDLLQKFRTGPRGSHPNTSWPTIIPMSCDRFITQMKILCTQHFWKQVLVYWLGVWFATFFTANQSNISKRNCLCIQGVICYCQRWCMKTQAVEIHSCLGGVREVHSSFPGWLFRCLTKCCKPRSKSLALLVSTTAEVAGVEHIKQLIWKFQLVPTLRSWREFRVAGRRSSSPVPGHVWSLLQTS